MMKGLVSLFGFEEKVGDVRFYYKGPTINPSEFYLLIIFCVAMIGLSFGFGSKVIMWIALLLLLMVWVIVDWYYAKRALRAMRDVVIETKEVNLSEVKIWTDGKILGWEYRGFEGVIRK